MDLPELAKKLDLAEPKHVVRRAAELLRLCDIQFDSSIIGVGEVCKAVICLEIATTRNKLDVRELAIKFGRVRIIPFVQKGLFLYKSRFLASLPASRRASANFTRPAFIAVAFYLCAKKQKLKVDKLKLIELSGASESELSSVSTSMKDLCFDICGIEKEKKDPKEVKGNRDLVDVFPEKRKLEDGGYSSNEGAESSIYKRHKKLEKHMYEGWKTSVLKLNEQTKAKGYEASFLLQFSGC